MKLLGTLVLILILAVAAALFFGPREPVDRSATVDPASLPADLDAWLAEREAAVPNLRPGAEKRIVWAGEPGVATPLSVVYLHGFSATSEEIRPVPDEVAAGLGANLFFTRLAGHGRDGPAMAEPVAGDWIADLAEAMAIGRRIGGRVLLIGTSSGGTLATLAATDPVLSQGMAGVVLISPNYRINSPAAFLLGLPWVRQWGPLVAPERGFEPRSAGHAAWWTTNYPTIAAVPLQALVQETMKADFAATRVPALFLYSVKDQVVVSAAADTVYAEWGGSKARDLRVMGPGDDPGSHVIAGDIMSPGQTEQTVQIILDWAEGI
ncbi:carboxylesterase [Tropicimonas sp. IMCC34043]|uniref:alpha/beta hydrolase n=1 Tax=Tropicimonas sp. IMCC34043 TaxID=2248760 RepID=UPI000E2505EF|nr:alpha/beta fold hydrolase [Tropicimonas sp. IMCC34043]